MTTQKPRMVDMDDVAKRVGVSKTTVHYALRNTGRVSLAMRKRVLQVVKEMGYRPNGLARSLRVRRTDTLGVILVDLTSSFYRHLLAGIDSAAQQHRHLILVSCSYGTSQKEQELIEILLEKGVDGLIVAPADPELNRDYYRRLASEGVKLVFVDRDVPGINVDLVSTDNQTGAYLAVQHLLRRGRKRIIALPTRPRDRRSTSVQDRIEGYERATAEAGLKPLLVLGPNLPDTVVEEEYAYQTVLQYISKSRAKFDGIFAIHDGLAYGAIRALLEAGLRVPEEVAVVGFDDQDPSAYFQPPLTTVRQPMHQIGIEAVRLLFRRLAEPNSPSSRQRLALEPNIIVRQSCGGGSG